LTSRFPFPGLPSGWYVVAPSDEVKPGEVIGRRYFEQEIAIFRTKSGEVRVVDAHCPHMGAHLAKVGRVEDEKLVCGFHGFQYEGSGKCVGTSYGGPAPHRARLRNWRVKERNGLVLVWYHPEDDDPDWDVPSIEDTGDWTKMAWKRFRIATHPQETTENSVDFGHFTQIHGFVDGSILEPVEVEGPLLTTTYRAFRPLPLPSMNLFQVPVDYKVCVWGLGYSQVEIRIPAFRLDFRVWVLPVPIDGENIDLVIGAAAKKSLGPLAYLARRIALFTLGDEVEQDLDVWTYKKFLDTPALAKGDGPVAAYRTWAKQFYD
jgi:nitrite reductase/ring-hydroxylating ferredoxin subunit